MFLQLRVTGYSSRTPGQSTGSSWPTQKRIHVFLCGFVVVITWKVFSFYFVLLGVVVLFIIFFILLFEKEQLGEEKNIIKIYWIKVLK